MSEDNSTVDIRNNYFSYPGMGSSWKLKYPWWCYPFLWFGVTKRDGYRFKVYNHKFYVF